MIIKVAGARKKKAKRYGFAYEAINLQGTILFHGVSTCAADSTFNAIQEAMVIAAMKARNLGFTHVLFLSDNKRSTQVTNREVAPSCKKRILLIDMSHLNQSTKFFLANWELPLICPILISLVSYIALFLYPSLL